MSFDTEAFIDGYVLAALWADCLSAEPTIDELAECAAILGATSNYVARARYGNPTIERARLERDYGDYCRDAQETGGCEGLEIRPAARDRMAVDCRMFIMTNLEDLEAYCDAMGPWSGTDSRGYVEDEPAEARAGHDFWLSRSGHGTGFFDRGLGTLGDRLQDAAQSYGSPDNMTPVDMGDGTADTIGA